MAHITYKTKAIVLGRSVRGEANMVFSLLTADLGLLYAHGQGVRLERSKLRFSVQDFSVCDVMLVHGKTGWRLTNASLVFSPYYEIDKEAFGLCARVLGLIKKLVVGEESDPELFSICLQNIEELSKQKLDQKELSRIEIVWVLKILSRLGYVDLGSFSFFGDLSFNDIRSNQNIDNIRKEALVQINRAIESSHLYF